MFYIAIAAGAVSHKDLLLENPVKLPFLNVELPLVAFFVLAPIIFIISYAYTLVHFVMLGAKVGVFNTELHAQLGDAPETMEGRRRQLPSNIFVQFLAGPGDIRKGGLGLILKVIAWITLVIGPVLLLLLIQAQFLPYHLEWVTWVQRFAVLVDLILLWLLWPAVVNSRSRLMWRLERRGNGWPGVLTLTGRYIAGLTACFVPIGLGFTTATFPGEWLDEHGGNNQWIPPNGVTARLGARDPRDKAISTSFHDLLFNGEVDGVTQRRKSLFSNTLVLPEFDALEAAKIDNQKKLDTVKHTLSLRGRHLERAVFYGADLRKADLEGAELQGVSLGGARLQGASLKNAQLQGASLNGAQLQGASLDNAHLQGASLEAELQGASLRLAELQCASLGNAQLQGAELNAAQLQGAALNGAQLQGASLFGAQLQGAALPGAYLWRASLDSISFDAIAASELVWDKSARESYELPGHRWTETTFLALKKKIEDNVPAGSARDEALKRIEILDPGKPFEDQDRVPDWRKKIEDAEKASSIEPNKYEVSLAGELMALVCSRDTNAVYVARGLLNGILPLANSGAQAPGLIHAILGKECPVSATLTESDKTGLRQRSAVEMWSLICASGTNELNFLRGFLTDGYIKEAGDQAAYLLEAILNPKAVTDCPVSAALTEADKAALEKLKKEASGAH